MQKDEVSAAKLLRHFQKQVEKKVTLHKGEIVNFYGDGALCIFSDPLEAVNCASALQNNFRIESNMPLSSDRQGDKQAGIPVRIGIHSGTIVHEGGKAYGDSVNVASRIESMAVPGSVLVSSAVRNQLKNRPEFQLTSLGKFEFKNVQDSMTIYALANEGLVVPKRDEIKGKGQRVGKSGIWKAIYIVLPLLLLTGTLAFLQREQLFSSFSDGTEKGQDILKERIAVLPFKNNTNETDLDILGDMAADWINQGLMDIGEAEVVSPFTVRAHRDAIGILENDPDGWPSFAQLTGAQNLITGNYYKEKDDLIFKLELVDALEGKLRYVFEEIRGIDIEKERLINELRETVTGYWATREMVDSKRIHPPSYEAYALYLEFIRFQNLDVEGEQVQERLLSILNLDSTFYLPRIHFLNANRFGFDGNNEIHFNFLERHLANLSDYELAWLDFLKGMYLGNQISAFNSLNTIRKKFPKDFIINHEAATMTLEGLNNPELAMDIYNELPLEGIRPEPLGVYYNNRLRNHSLCLIRLGKSTEVIDFLDRHEANRKAEILVNDFMRLTHRLIGVRNTTEEAIIYPELENLSSQSPGFFIWLSSWFGNSNLLSDDVRTKLADKNKAIYEQLPQDDINRTLFRNYYAWLTNDASYIKTDDLHQSPITFRFMNLAYAGLNYIQSGKKEEAEMIIEKLEELTEPGYAVVSLCITSGVYHAIGGLQAQLGDYDLAMDNLRKAKALGASSWQHLFEFDPLLKPLYDRPDFQELIKPVWPEIKD